MGASSSVGFRIYTESSRLEAAPQELAPMGCHYGFA